MELVALFFLKREAFGAKNWQDVDAIFCFV